MCFHFFCKMAMTSVRIRCDLAECVLTRAILKLSALGPQHGAYVSSPILLMCSLVTVAEGPWRWQMVPKAFPLRPAGGQGLQGSCWF